MQDAVSKGRMTNQHAKKGIDTHWAKLSENEVIKIRQLYKIGSARKDLAIQFNTARSNVDFIVTYKSWKHLP